MSSRTKPIKVVDLKACYTCNNNCYFCAQASNRFHGDKTASTIEKELQESWEAGCEKVIFTGGEVTIRPDVVELVSYAKKLGFSQIQLQTNGRALFYMDLCRRLAEAGASEFAIALHGHMPELHDYLTRAPGSFLQTVEGIKNVKKLGLPVIANTVVVKPNYRHAEQIARLLVDLEVDQYQLAFVHAAGNAMKYFDKMVPFVSLAAPYIHEGLQVGIDEGVKAMAEAMPFCVMKGYEKYVSEFHIPAARIKEYDFTIPDFDSIRKNELKMKFPQCKDCKYELVCEGPWKEYPEKRGNEEFQPVRGKKITDLNQVLRR